MLVIRFRAIAFLSFLPAFALMAQQTAPGSAKPATKAVPATDIFSGSVTAFTPESLTVVRKVPAHPDEFRQFILDKDTKTEGRLRANARVSVQFRRESEGTFHALRVVVRVDGKAATGPGRTGAAQ